MRNQATGRLSTGLGQSWHQAEATSRVQSSQHHYRHEGTHRVAETTGTWVWTLLLPPPHPSARGVGFWASHFIPLILSASYLQNRGPGRGGCGGGRRCHSHRILEGSMRRCLWQSLEQFGAQFSAWLFILIVRWCGQKWVSSWDGTCWEGSIPWNKNHQSKPWGLQDGWQEWDARARLGPRPGRVQQPSGWGPARGDKGRAASGVWRGPRQTVPMPAMSPISHPPCSWSRVNTESAQRGRFMTIPVPVPLGTPFSFSLFSPQPVPGFPVLHSLPEFTQIHVHQVGDAIQPSHPLLPPSPPALNLSQHQGLSQWVSSLHQVAKVLQLQLQHANLQSRVVLIFLIAYVSKLFILYWGIVR